MTAQHTPTTPTGARDGAVLDPAAIAGGLRALAEAIESGHMPLGDRSFPDQALRMVAGFRSPRSVEAVAAAFGLGVERARDGEAVQFAVRVPFGPGARPAEPSSAGRTPATYQGAVVLDAYCIAAREEVSDDQ